MEIVIEASALKGALGRLQPRRKYKSMREDRVVATAGGGELVLVGTLDSSASVGVTVVKAGTASIPLEPAIRLLGTYRKGSTVRIRADAGGLYFDALRLAS